MVWERPSTYLWLPLTDCFKIEEQDWRLYSESLSSLECVIIIVFSPIYRVGCMYMSTVSPQYKFIVPYECTPGSVLTVLVEYIN